jgi:hypothetical protein
MATKEELDAVRAVEKREADNYRYWNGKLVEYRAAAETAGAL